jgi:hypothetical protein
MFLIEVNWSFPLSKIEHNYATPFVFGVQNMNGNTFPKSLIYKGTKQNLKKTMEMKNFSLLKGAVLC